MDRLIRAAEKAEGLGPVECILCLTTRGVDIRMRLDMARLLKKGPPLGYAREVSWLDIMHAEADPLAYWMAAMRQELLASAEGPESRNLNRERAP